MKKNLISRSLKYVIAAISIAGTVGLWGVFSKKDARAVSVLTTEQPLPTIATLVGLDQTVSTSVAAPDSSISSLPVVTQPPTNSSLGSSMNQLQMPAPITSSKSSR